MHAVIYLNKAMVEASQARVTPVSSAMLCGRGVFTTLAIHRSQPFLWAKHWSRLTTHAAKLNLELTGLSEKSVGEALRKLIAVNHVTSGRARVVLLARSGHDIWKTPAVSGSKIDLLIMTADLQKVRSTGLTLAVSPFRVNTSSALVGIKSLNYLDHVLSWEEAHQRDFDEAVMLNERGEIVSATMANIFWVKDGKIHTPTLNTGAVDGITRQVAISLADKHFIPVVEGVYEMPDLTDADEIFLTAASLGIEIVTTFDFRQYSVATGSIAARLRESFQSLTSELGGLGG